MTSIAISDDEIKKSFVESQAKMIEFQRQLNSVRSQIQAKDHERRAAMLTLREVSLFENVPLYKAVGRMFLKDTKENILSGLNSKIESSKDEVAKLEKNAEYFDRNLKDVESSLRELLQKRYE
ncbi:Prefoldin [Rozella allomycis CSF55]|uniref:Prefoldin n=1 Tax=Rozella allomycis (strain CSF55) TaxID=988480 RepID=A0A075AV58_ROZAC|nr:hypothetical protein O9G_001346 [Rozella allomycis CSF55]RKP18907.1 Prefoldin [Rozella allomycis CSF55]|eukprot:EPZ32444.1 hypothetical protein O9G_001346 [Rozella allomycis CSF55]